MITPSPSKSALSPRSDPGERVDAGWTVAARLARSRQADTFSIEMFFADEAAATASYRPCGVCMQAAYQAWEGSSC